MAEKPWYEKLLKTNPNLSLKDVLEYKIAEVTLLSERVIADKVEKLKDGVKKKLFTEDVLESGEKKIREETEKNRYKYDLDSLAERLDRDFPSLLKDAEGNPITELTARQFLENVVADPAATLAILANHDPLIEFFSTEFTVPKSTMSEILFRKWSPTETYAARKSRPPRAPKAPETEPETPKEPATVVEEGMNSEVRRRLIIRNHSDHSHAIKLSVSDSGVIHIDIMPDARVAVTDKQTQLIHSRKRVLLYTEGGSSASPEYDVGSTSVVL